MQINLDGYPDPGSRPLSLSEWGWLLNPHKTRQRTYSMQGRKDLLTLSQLEEILKLKGFQSSHSVGALFGVSHMTIGTVWNARGKYSYLKDTFPDYIKKSSKVKDIGINGIYYSTLRKKFEVILRRGADRKCIRLYYGSDYFEACCRRKAWERDNETA